MKQANILVFGSYLAGLTMRVRAFPAAGETVMGHSYAALHGGKGSNQAVAAARLGAKVRFAGCVGDDALGHGAMALFAQEGVDTTFSRVCKDMPTGVGFILVDDAGENQITLDTGACKCMDAAFALAASDAIRACDTLLMQLETPLDGVLQAARLARDAGKMIILNPAPYQTLPPSIFPLLDLITPNRGEARQMLGLSASDASAAPDELADGIRALGARNVVITLGGEGAYFAGEHDRGLCPACPVCPVDTTGAGDTFSAALAVALCEEKDLREAICFAQHAAALSVQKYGVIDSLPYRAEVEGQICKGGKSSDEV